MSSGWVFKHCALYFMDRHIKSRWHIFATCFTKKWDTVQSHSSLNHKMFYDFSKRWVGGKGDDKVFDKSLEAKTESEYYDYRKIWGLIWQRSLAIFEENIFVQDLIFHTLSKTPHTGAKSHFLSINSLEFDISKYVNFVKNEILKMRFFCKMAN